jgi:hypothetical protein
VTMGQPGQSEQLAPPVHKNLQNKNAKLYWTNGGYIARLDV